MKDDLEQLDWLAFQYVFGELPDAAQADFEQRLADDQEAREAVARAVELGAAIVSASSVTSSTSAPTPAHDSTAKRISAARWWVVAATVAGIAIGFSYALVEQYNVASRPVLAPTESSAALPASELATVWGERRDEWMADQNEQWKTNEADVAEADDTEIAAPDVAAPDWMLLAVSDLAKDMDMIGDVPEEGN